MNEPAAVYDIETEDWTKFVLGTIAYADGRVEIHRTEAAMVRALMAIDGEVYAHNGGRFDHLWLIDANPIPANVQSSSSGIVSLKFEGVGPTFLDTYRIFPMKLADLTGGAKGSLADLCNCGEACGGFCRVTRKMPRQVRARVEEYAIQDSRSLMQAIQFFAGFAADNRIEIKRTLGASAWATASAECGVEAFEGTLPQWKDCRAGYHGGRTEVFRTDSPAGFVYDINSAYPGALLHDLPVGKPTTVTNATTAARRYRAGVPGIYFANVEVPEAWIPPLPVALDDGLTFPVGRFSGSWPLPELQYAESVGARILDVFECVTFPRVEPVFRPWVQRLYGLRHQYGKDSREGKWLKWILNSLTGKLGSRNESRRVKIRPDMSSLGDGWCPLTETGTVWEQTITMKKVEPCAHPEMAAYLTGRVRVQLHQMLTEGGADDAVYTDTDSAWTERPRSGNLGTNLGTWSADGFYVDFECAGPKTYRASVVKEPGGVARELVKAKGIPNPKWEKVITGFPSEFVSFAGIRRSKNGKVFVKLNSSRRVTKNTGRRLRLVDGDARTFPPTYKLRTLGGKGRKFIPGAIV